MQADHPIQVDLEGQVIARRRAAHAQDGLVRHGQDRDARRQLVESPAGVGVRDAQAPLAVAHVVPVPSLQGAIGEEAHDHESSKG